MIKQIKDFYRELFLFFKKPVDQPDSNQTLREKSKILFFVLILDLIIAVICALFLLILEKQGLFSEDNHLISEFLKSMPKGAVIIAAVFVIPLVEEPIFRLYLRYKNNYLLRLFISLFYLTGRDRKERVEKRIKNIWYKRYGYIFYFSAILFGFVHIFNFDTYKNLLLIFPIITAPQILLGLFAGYLRVRFNLIWGYFLHAIHNLVFLIPLLFAGDSLEVFQTDTNDYSIKIEEVFRSDKKQTVQYFSDSVFCQNCKLKYIIAYTANTDSWLINNNNDKKMNIRLNIQYKNKSDSHFVDRQIIEKELAGLYNFSITKENRLVSVWTLLIEDSLKLNKYKVESGKTNSISFSKDSAIMRGVQLAGISYAIQTSKKKRVFLKNNIEGKFDIRLRITDTLNLKKQLDSIYGLKLVDSSATIEYLNVEFKNK